MFEGSNIEITDENGFSFRELRFFGPILQFIQKLQLMSKFFIDSRVRLITTCGNIEIMNGQRFGFGRVDFDRNMPGIAFFAKFSFVDLDDKLIFGGTFQRWHTLPDRVHRRDHRPVSGCRTLGQRY